MCIEWNHPKELCLPNKYFGNRADLEQKCRKLSTEIEVVRAERESIIAQKVTFENKVRQLECDIEEKVNKFESIIREVHMNPLQ